MARPIAKWRARSGLRKTLVTDTVSVDLEAWPCGNDPVQKVRFTIEIPGGPGLVTDQFSRSLRSPNYSSKPMKRIWGYGVTIDCGAMPGGIIKVSAIVYSVSGESTALPGAIWVLNDSDGIDRRSSSRLVHVNAQTGNDANPGTAGSPVQTIKQAVLLSRNNPGGSTFSDTNAGGAKIIASGNFVGVSTSFGMGDWHTGDNHEWLTIEATPGTTIQRTIPGTYTEPQDLLACTGHLNSGICRTRWIGWTVKGDGPVLAVGGWPTTSVKGQDWWDDVEHYSSHWNPANQWSVRYFEDSGNVASFSGVGTDNKRFISNYRRYGCSFGVTNATELTDFSVGPFMGVALQSNEPADSISNGEVKFQRYDTIEVKGYIDCTGGSLFTVSVPVAGTMRVEATGTVFLNNSSGIPTAVPVNLHTQLGELSGTTFFGILLDNAGAGNSGEFLVTATGTTGGGNPYFEVANPSAVPGVAPAGCRVRTIKYQPGQPTTPRFWQQLVHPDILQWNSDRFESVVNNVATKDVRQAQGFFTGHNNLNRCVMHACSDGGSELRNNFSDGSIFTDCIFSNNTFSGPWDFTLGAASTGNLIVNNVCKSMSEPPTGPTNIVSHNHFITGTPQGINATSGPWFATNPAVDPYSPIPLIANFNTATTSYYSMSPSWRWPGASLDSRGVFADDNWGIVGVNLGATFSGTSSMTAAAVLRLGLSASFAGTASLSASVALKMGLGASFLGQATISANLQVNQSVELSAVFSGTNSLSITANLKMAIAATLSGTSSVSATAYLGSPIFASAVFEGFNLIFANSTLVPGPYNPTSPSRTLMKQRIYNALVALVKTGPFYPCVVNPKNGEMTVDQSKTVTPGVTVKEIQSSFRSAANYRRSFLVSELENWSWEAVAEFTGIEVACETFETNVIAGGIKIPEIVGLPNQRTLLVRLVGSRYGHPPEQSANRGTRVVFEFEVVPDTLRK